MEWTRRSPHTAGRLPADSPLVHHQVQLQPPLGGGAEAGSDQNLVLFGRPSQLLDNGAKLPPTPSLPLPSLPPKAPKTTKQWNQSAVLSVSALCMYRRVGSCESDNVVKDKTGCQLFSQES